MSGRLSEAVAKALKLVAKGKSKSEAARLAGCNVVSVRRALQRAKKEAKP